MRVAPLIRGGGAIGGWAAALMLGCADADGFALDGTALPVLLCLPRASRCRRVEDVRVFRSDLAPEEMVDVDGVAVTSLVRTSVDLARLSRSYTEAVVWLDLMLRRSVDLVGPVHDWLGAHSSWTGARLARRALADARPGTESVQETRLRLLWTHDAGLPQPLVNPTLYDSKGAFLARVDLLDPASAVVGEYDGWHHAEADRRARDHRRRQRLEGCGLTVIQHTSVDLGPGRDEAVRRLRSARSVGLRRDRALDRWRIGPTLR